MTIERDELFKEAARLVVKRQCASMSIIMIHFGLGYNRASKIIDQLELYSIAEGFKGDKCRKVCFENVEMLDEYLNRIDENHTQQNNQNL